MTQKPETLNADLANLPPAMRPFTQESRWVVWRWEWRAAKGNGGGKWTKPPYTPQHFKSPAKSKKPDTWGTYAKALAVVQAGNADGIGLMLFGSELAAADIDKCLTGGEPDPWAQTIIDTAFMEGCYVEKTYLAPESAW